MTLSKMAKEIVATNWITARCTCGREYEYPASSLYKPKTCGRLDCELKHLHPELNKKRRQ